jgi:hypothetical protein
MFGYYKRITVLQKLHIKRLERYNDFTQTYLALAYLRSARGHIRMNHYVRAIDTLWMISHTYSYVNKEVIILFKNCYRILIFNSNDLVEKRLWNEQKVQDFHLLEELQNKPESPKQ